MFTLARTLRAGLLAVLAGTFVTAATGLAGQPADDPIKDRSGFIPHRKHQLLKGTAVGVLVSDPQPILSTEGRSGPTDTLCFATGGASYRWMYVPTIGNAQIRDLRVPVGERLGGKTQTYASLDLARLTNLAPWGINRPYLLVEVEVNNGLGSPPNDSFVGTDFKVLEGTPDYPLNATAVIQDLRSRYDTYVKDQTQALETALEQARKKALKDQKATGPREKQDLMYITWLPETQRLRVHFRTKVSDGAYSYVGGGARPIDPPIRDLPLKQVPPGGLPMPPPNPGGPGGPPRPGEFKVRVGTTYGVEFGMAYEVGKDGKVVRVQPLAFESFQQTLPPPPIIRPGRDPLPPPPPPPPPRIKKQPVNR